MREGLAPAAALDWAYLGDAVMGGRSDGRMTREIVDGREVLRLAGRVSTENRGGFIQMRTEVPGGLPDRAGGLVLPDRARGLVLPDRARGLVLRVRGNAERYFVHLRTRASVLPWQFRQAGFDTGPDWAEVRLPWAAFAARGGPGLAALHPGGIRSVGLAAYGRDHAADLWLSDIGWF